MKKLILLVLLALSTNAMAQSPDVAQADDNRTNSVKSPQNRVALLELYTSEGCSSCPPADRFLSELTSAGISSKQLIPMAFHVTYWDYIGWKDRFASEQYDNRQRDLAHKHNSKSIYTPQFVLVGEDYRKYKTFSSDINKLVSQKAKVDLELEVKRVDEEVQLKLKSDITDSDVKEVGFYFVIVENNLSSDVSDGENEGEVLHHNYVVRKLSDAYYQSKPNNQLVKEHTIKLDAQWKKRDLSIVAFAENPHTGEVLQAVRLKY